VIEKTQRSVQLEMQFGVAVSLPGGGWSYVLETIVAVAVLRTDEIPESKI
jgi:hypothetical protein